MGSLNKEEKEALEEQIIYGSIKKDFQDLPC